MKTILRKSAIPFFILIFATATVWIFAQGGLTPPGPPAPTMKTLAQVEPRTPVSSLAGDATTQYVISQPGSYYLTGNLTGESGKSAIAILASSVTLDFCGFSMIGVPGADIAIYDQSFNLNGNAILNGTIRDWPGRGLDLGSRGARIQNISVINNGGGGISAGSGAVITECTAVQNMVFGIAAGNASVISRCTASHTEDGPAIFLSLGGTISDCAATFNSLEGFSSGGDTSIHNCVARDNLGIGFVIGNGSTIQNCSAIGNGSHGISADFNCLIQNNTSANNAQSILAAGIYVTGSDNRIDGNNVLNNEFGIRNAISGNFIARNTASSNLTNYSLFGTNTVGPIITDLGTIASTNPWANFEY